MEILLEVLTKVDDLTALYKAQLDEVNREIVGDLNADNVEQYIIANKLIGKLDALEEIKLSILHESLVYLSDKLNV